MANNRLFLKCRSCGEELRLASWWGDRFDRAPTHVRVEEFLNEHWLCPGNASREPREMFILTDEQGRSRRGARFEMPAANDTRWNDVLWMRETIQQLAEAQ